MIDPKRVAVFHNSDLLRYPQAPFHPPLEYPELNIPGMQLDPTNGVYAGVRELFRLLQFDVAHYGTPEWNPLGDLVSSGDKVVLKPNLVVSEHPEGDEGMTAAITNGSLVRAILDYVILATGGDVGISIVDSPIKETDFDRALIYAGIRGCVAYVEQYAGISIEIIDLRDLFVVRNKFGVMEDVQDLPGDPRGYVFIDLGQQSAFADIAHLADRLRSTAAIYDNQIIASHNGKTNRYSISRTVLEADVFINLPKLKTHKKDGVTLSMKNLIGLTNRKEWLPHHRVGPPKDGGDEYPDQANLKVKLHGKVLDWVLSTRHVGRVAHALLSPIYRGIRSVVPQMALQKTDKRFGEWYGNDTLWRTIHDLNAILFFADVDGNMHSTPQRRYLTILDAVVAGEGNGPLSPQIKPCGLLVGGLDPVATDIVCCQLMGFDHHRLPTYRRSHPNYPVSDVTESAIQIASNSPEIGETLQDIRSSFNFSAATGWQDILRLEECAV